MSYHIMRRSSDPKIIGVKNGGSQARIEREGFSDKSNYDKYSDFFADRSSAIWTKLDKLPDFDCELEYVKLERNARFTDFLSYYPQAFRGNYLLSEKAVRVIERHRIPTHKKILSKVYADDGDYVTYYLFYFPALDYNIINFDKTIFYTGSELIGKDYFQVHSSNEFETIRPKAAFNVEKMVLSNEFDLSLDIFSTKINSEFIVSSKLRNTLEEEKLTGINLVEAKGPRQMTIVHEKEL